MPYLGACGICLWMGDVVRDHDHDTGFIRGWLCNKCNRYLGLYEGAMKRGWRIPPKRGYRKWAKKFRHRIRFHLNKNTGIRYERSGEAPRSLHKRTVVDIRNVSDAEPRKPKRGKSFAPKSKVAKVLSKADREAQSGLEEYRARIRGKK